ncbi:MAG: efflux RND transporter periplasmic adaptor subunit [Isosphaeraceae bacterium]
MSNYSLWAPFDGTILDREMIIPGVPVDTNHRMFTLADLSRVYVEVHIHEHDFDILEGTRGGRVKFTSPAFPGRSFAGEVIYSGDLVEDTSRTVKLLARAENPRRVLKPGMFVDVEVMSPNGKPAVQIPASALLTHADRTFVFVRTAPDRFAERDVTAEGVVGDQLLITHGLKADEEVVTQGAYKLKALAAGQPAPEH